MERIVLAFLGVCIYVDVVADGGKTIAQPERLAYLLVEEWLKAGNELRSDPIYKDLFQPYSFNHIAQSARNNPVVMISLWGSRCDALILFDAERSKSIGLEGMTEELAAALQSKFRGGLQTDHFRSRGDEASDERGTMPAPNIPDIQKVLSVLWRVVVKPIFDAMELQPIENPCLDPPRMTWCPTGPTSFFPLHAAGLYDTQDKGTKSYEYVASSYIPTLSILANANVALSQEEERPFKGILAVSQPNEGGQVEIEKTVDEVRDLISIVGDAAHLQWLNGKEATKEKVLVGMGSSTWVHLACHARQYPLNTSESAFLLDSGESLSLADISENASAEGELAFLSACQTAAGDFDVSEEGVHLAAGMLVAGYRSVIATAWSVRDKDAPEVAKEVYRRLLKDGKVDRTGAGLALHHATRLLRESVGEDQFMRWAPFIHLGV
ncbi:CHAT domain-containing protein [Coprinopsis sp. MPI-PUGE-AT-0042]|nr:CHAT domain-containing protein [Coprinopsis sp. MPI-PUGE-AT-0042]